MTGQLAVYAAVFLVGVPALAWWIVLDCERAHMRRLMRSIVRSFDAFAATIGAALIPAMQQAVAAAADFEKAMRQVAAAVAQNDTLAELQRLADQSRKDQP